MKVLQLSKPTYSVVHGNWRFCWHYLDPERIENKKSLSGYRIIWRKLEWPSYRLPFTFKTDWIILKGWNDDRALKCHCAEERLNRQEKTLPIKKLKLLFFHSSCSQLGSSSTYYGEIFTRVFRVEGNGKVFSFSDTFLVLSSELLSLYYPCKYTLT